MSGVFKFIPSTINKSYYYKLEPSDGEGVSVYVSSMRTSTRPVAFVAYMKAYPDQHDASCDHW